MDPSYVFDSIPLLVTQISIDNDTIRLQFIQLLTDLFSSSTNSYCEKYDCENSVPTTSSYRKDFITYTTRFIDKQLEIRQLMISVHHSLLFSLVSLEMLHHHHKPSFYCLWSAATTQPTSQRHFSHRIRFPSNSILDSRTNTRCSFSNWRIQLGPPPYRLLSVYGWTRYRQSPCCSSQSCDCSLYCTFFPSFLHLLVV